MSLPRLGHKIPNFTCPKTAPGSLPAVVRRAKEVLGDPDEVGEIYADRLIPGVDVLTVNAPANCHIEGRVGLLGNVLAKVIGS